MHEFPGVTFHPWVGSHYGGSDNHFGVRLLVLGESHYVVLNESDQDQEWINKMNSSGDEHVFTQYVVRKWAQENKHRFFTVTANVLLGREKGGRDDVNSEI